MNMINEIPLFTELTPDQKALIAEGIRIQQFPRSAVLITQGDLSDSLFVLLSGRLKVYIVGVNGREILLDFLEPTAAFGELSLIDGQPRSASVMTVEACRLAVLPRQHFLDCLEKHPAIAIILLKTLVQRSRGLVGRIGDMALLDVYGRVSNILLARVSKESEDAYPTLTITHQELANLVGSSREMITRILNDLKKGGFITIENRQITLINPLPKRW
jgi:CRP/FNR family cyclic AMP-dependent transcriptional regulator